MYNYSTISDGDLGNLIAYLKQIPPVDSEQPEVSYGPIIPIFPAIGLFTPAAEMIEHNAPRLTDPIAGATKEYGNYLSVLCTACHGTNLVAPVRGKYMQEDFVRAIRTGILPNGTQIGRAMPPSTFGEMTDTELVALWLYLQNPPSSQTR